MKPVPILSIVIAGILSACFFGPWEARGAIVAASFDSIDQLIPDGSAIGWSDRRTISANFGVIESVTVSLNITGGFNGDLYAQLTHGTGFSVLLNRVGRNALNPIGYSDGGLNVQLNDGLGAAGDIHKYRLTLSGVETIPLGGPLTGVWKVDGRITDPDLVLDSDPRVALQNSFNGLDPNGEWTLFVADVSGGGQSTVRSWGLTVQGVPEPGVGGLLLVSLSCWCGFGRLRQVRTARTLLRG